MSINTIYIFLGRFLIIDVLKPSSGVNQKNVKGHGQLIELEKN